jgi:hypothetical protein
MKLFKHIALATVTIATFSIAFAGHLVEPPSGKSCIWLVGDSSLHKYSSMANDITVVLSFTPESADKSAAEKIATGSMKTLDVTVPVAKMRSGEDGLDRNMQKTLKGEKNPNILFHLENYRVAPSSMQAGDFSITAAGQLQIAGVTKEIELNGRLTPEDSGVRIRGMKDVLMTDYGIKPPKILLIKTANEVDVHFDLHIDKDGKLIDR